MFTGVFFSSTPPSVCVFLFIAHRVSKTLVDFHRVDFHRGNSITHALALSARQYLRKNMSLTSQSQVQNPANDRVQLPIRSLVYQNTQPSKQPVGNICSARVQPDKKHHTAFTFRGQRTRKIFKNVPRTSKKVPHYLARRNR